MAKKTQEKTTKAATKTATKSTARRQGTVKKRGWSLDKFTASVTKAAKRREVPAKAISKAAIEKHYEGGSSVKATVDSIAA
jgi:hypothetical protein